MNKHRIWSWERLGNLANKNGFGSVDANSFYWLWDEDLNLNARSQRGNKAINTNSCDKN